MNQDETPTTQFGIPAPETLPHGIPLAFDPKDATEDVQGDDGDIDFGEGDQGQMSGIDPVTDAAVVRAIALLKSVGPTSLFAAQRMNFGVEEIIVLATFLMDPMTGYRFIPEGRLTPIETPIDEIIEVQTNPRADVQ